MKSRALIGVLVIAVPVIAFLTWRHYFPIGVDYHDFGVNTADQVPVVLDKLTLGSVRLPPEKLKAAGVELSYVTLAPLRPENRVPGRLCYDARRHVEVRSATSGVITVVHVNPGNEVRAGDVLIELNSSDVGNARADVLLRRSELSIAIENRNREKEIFDGLGRLTAAIQARKPLESIKQEFRNVTLGKSREQLLSAYSDLLLAQSLVNAARDNANSGVVPSRMIEERINSRDNTEAALHTGLEELNFSARLGYQRAEAQVADADRRLKISQQAVRSLLGESSPDDGSSSAMQDDPSNSADLTQASLSLVQLRAPFGGTIERRVFSPSERVTAGESMLTLADTSTLWVAADLREREWNALALNPGDEIRVETTVPGIETLTAKVHFVGREVDPASNAIPLVAIIDNPNGTLRPGMFVRVSVPTAESREAITIPESSVLEHDRETFVFGPDGDSAFRRINIISGMRVDGRVEVVSGLSPGDQVVSSGGFHLKSELLLEGEE